MSGRQHAHTAGHCYRYPARRFTMVKDLTPSNVEEFQKFIDFSSANKILIEKVEATKFMVKF